jgi:hypothetical protein
MGTESPMIRIVYGSPAVGSPNNWALSSADLADDAPVNAQYLRTGSNNYPPSPSPFHAQWARQVLFCLLLGLALG